MPSLIRLLIAIAIMVGGLYGGAYALVTFYEPAAREITHSIPSREIRLEAVPDSKPKLVEEAGEGSAPVGTRQ